MPGTIHLLTGAALALLISHAPTMVALSFFSHYLLDLLPHIDPMTFSPQKKVKTWMQTIGLAVDTILVITFMLGLYLLQNKGGYILIGALMAQLPDLLAPLDSYGAFFPIRRMHRMFHWEESRANTWHWFILGLAAESALSIATIVVIWKY